MLLKANLWLMMPLLTFLNDTHKHSKPRERKKGNLNAAWDLALRSASCQQKHLPGPLRSIWSFLKRGKILTIICITVIVIIIIITAISIC